MQPPTQVHLGNIMKCSDGTSNRLKWMGQRWERRTQVRRQSCFLFALLTSRVNCFVVLWLILSCRFSFLSLFHKLLLPSLSWPLTRVVEWRIHTARHFVQGEWVWEFVVSLGFLSGSRDSGQFSAEVWLSCPNTLAVKHTHTLTHKQSVSLFHWFFLISALLFYPYNLLHHHLQYIAACFNSLTLSQDKPLHPSLFLF